MKTPLRLIIGISGASGAPLAIDLLQSLKKTPIETHVILSHGGLMTLLQETPYTLDDLKALADHFYDPNDLSANPASGTWKSMGMVVIPCSMKTLAGIHSGYSDNLLLRAADVTLKERRKLVLVTRETPFNTIHLRNMYELSNMGAIILPAMLSYYQQPQSIEDMTHHIVGKVLDLFDLPDDDFRRWEHA